MNTRTHYSQSLPASSHDLFKTKEEINHGTYTATYSFPNGKSFQIVHTSKNNIQVNVSDSTQKYEEPVQFLDLEYTPSQQCQHAPAFHQESTPLPVIQTQSTDKAKKADKTSEAGQTDKTDSAFTLADEEEAASVFIESAADIIKVTLTNADIETAANTGKETFKNADKVTSTNAGAEASKNTDKVTPTYADKDTATKKVSFIQKENFYKIYDITNNCSQFIAEASADGIIALLTIFSKANPVNTTRKSSPYKTITPLYFFA